MIRIFLFLWCVLPLESTDNVPDLFMFLHKNQTHINVFCVATDDRAIFWAGNDSKKIGTPGFKIPVKNRVELSLNETKLNVNKTMGFPLPIVLDSRWNGFTFYRGPNVSTVVNITGSGINLSLTGPSLKITLIGSVNITVNIKGKTINGEAKNMLDRGKFEWIHLLLSWTGRIFSVSDRDGRTIFTREENSKIDLRTVTFDVGENSQFALHEYFWYDLSRNLSFNPPKKESCLVLYYTMNETCVLNVNISSKTKENITFTLRGTERKWMMKNLTELSHDQVISISVHKQKSERDFFAVDVRRCPSEPKVNQLSATFRILTAIECHSFGDGEHRAISYQNGTSVQLMGMKIFHAIRNKTKSYRFNGNQIICTGVNKCYVPKGICNNNHGAQIYCQKPNKKSEHKRKPVRVSVRWKTRPDGEASNYFYKFCETKGDTCEDKLQGKSCNIKAWKSYTCSSIYLKENFDYFLLTYRRDSVLNGTYIPVECTNHTTSVKDPTPLTVNDTTEEGILILRVVKQWSEIVGTRLELNLENGTNLPFYHESTKEERHLVYKLTGVRASATYNATLHVQTEQNCTYSKVIKVHTPPTILTLREPPVLNCTQTNCTVQVGRSMQATANSSLHIFVTDVSNLTTPNVTVNETSPKSCGEAYNATLGRWITYQAPSEVSVFKTRRKINERNTYIIAFDIESSNVSFYKMDMLLIDEYYDKVTCTLYSIDPVVKDQKTSRGSSTVPKSEGSRSEGINSGVIAGLVLLFVLTVIALFVVYKKKELWVHLTNYARVRRNSDPRSTVSIPCLKVKPQSKPVQVNELEEYVKKSIRVPGEDEDELTRQFNLCPPGQTQPWEYGKLPANSKKNRYRNIIAYDHSRVVLSKLPGDDFSDYINANYVRDGDETYIAMQGPKKNTMNDFWRMIWEQNSPVVIMLTRFTENDKPKCEKYWPDESETYGQITVSLISQQYHADYCGRIFNLNRGDVNKQLTHLHYELWPDHGVPNCQSLASFVGAIPSRKSTGPQIVHCSAGCGRTGTLILALICLKSARQTGQVDFLHSLATIRKYRVDLVQNKEQYKVTHLLVLETLFKEDYTVTCDGRLKFAIVNRKADAERQVCYLDKIYWRDVVFIRGGEVVEIAKENDGKNRFPQIIPHQCSTVIIPRYPISDVHSDYINAVLIEKFYASIPSQNFEEVEADYANAPTFHGSAEYVVTQQPLPNTIGDFWRMVLDREVEIVVSLNNIDLRDQSSCLFWPESGREIKPTPFCKLRFLRGVTDGEAYDVVTLEVQSEHYEYRIVTVVIMKDWNAGESTPGSKRHLLELVQYIQTLSVGQIASNHPIAVTCHDGATASGLFLTLITTMEMVEVEKEFDVCRVVRAIRRSRKEFMREIEQFRCLYDVILDYFDDQPIAQRHAIYNNVETDSMYQLN